jgi:hypothetical protein
VGANPLRISTGRPEVARLDSMTEEKPPNPLSDVAQGLGLLFRAARTAARKLPTKDLEEAVVASAREVGRAIENVAATIERGVRGNKGGPPADRPGQTPSKATPPRDDDPKSKPRE